MILFLDDNWSRTALFKAAIPSAYTADTAPGMIALLEKHQPADYVFLDHDLGGATYVDSSRDDTGMGVVRWIVEKKPPIKRVFVHSLNYEAAEEMVAKLKDAGYTAGHTPFTHLDFDKLAAIGKEDSCTQ